MPSYHDQLQAALTLCAKQCQSYQSIPSLIIALRQDRGQTMIHLQCSPESTPQQVIALLAKTIELVATEGLPDAQKQ